MVGTCSAHGRHKMHTKLCSENVNGRAHTEDLNMYGSILLKWITKSKDGSLLAEFVWQRMRPSGVFF
jgi:hypothetical protein